jgi:hypothetical protein
MKRLILFLMTAVLCLEMISCGNSNQTQDPADQPSDSTSTSTSTSATQEETTATPQPDIGSVESIELCYCCNLTNAITITDAQTIATLLSYMKNANGERGETTWGHCGVIFGLTITTTDGNSYHFDLWDEDSYATSADKDENGYPYFYLADMSEMYNYLNEKYPADFWY